MDYETTSKYKLTITISDPDGLTAVQVVSINVIDVNEAPVIQNLPDSVTIAEDVMGTTSVFIVNTVDQDGDVITYTISASPSYAPFDIDSAGINAYNAQIFMYKPWAGNVCFPILNCLIHLNTYVMGLRPVGHYKYLIL